MCAEWLNFLLELFQNQLCTVYRDNAVDRIVKNYGLVVQLTDYCFHVSFVRVKLWFKACQVFKSWLQIAFLCWNIYFSSPLAGENTDSVEHSQNIRCLFKFLFCSHTLIKYRCFKINAVDSRLRALFCIWSFSSGFRSPWGKINEQPKSKRLSVYTVPRTGP